MHSGWNCEISTAKSRIGDLVYLDAATPTDGQSLVEVAGPIIEASRAAGQMVQGMELVLYPGKDPMNYYGVTDPAQIAWMHPKLMTHFITGEIAHCDAGSRIRGWRG